MHKETIERVLKYVTFEYLYLNVFVILFSLFQYSYLPVPAPFSLSIINQIFCWFTFTKGNVVIKSLDCMLKLLVYIFIILVYYLDHTYYVTINIFVLISFLIRMNWKCKSTGTHEYNTILQFLKHFYRFSELVACFCVTLKLSGFVGWTWPQTFWWYWMFLSALLGFSFTILMIIVSKALNEYCNNDEQNLTQNEFKPMFWYFYVSFSSTIIASLWIINTFEILNLEIPLDIGIKTILIIISTNILCFSILTNVLYERLVQFTMSLCNPENNQVEQVGAETPKKVIPKRQELRAMKFLKRLSSAYYQEITEKEVGKKQITSNEIFTERNASNKMFNLYISTPTEKNKLQSQEAQNTSNFKCIVCCESEANAVLMKCGHGGICLKCATQILQKNRECFLCRKEITEILEIDNQRIDFPRVLSSIQMPKQLIKNKN